MLEGHEERVVVRWGPWEESMGGGGESCCSLGVADAGRGSSQCQTLRQGDARL